MLKIVFVLSAANAILGAVETFSHGPSTSASLIIILNSLICTIILIRSLSERKG